MQVKTVLNRVYKVKGFVYGKVRFVNDWIEVEVRPRKGSRPICSGCGELILNWFKAKKEFNSGIVEGLNYKIKLTIRKAYGYRELKVAEIAINHALGQLPELKLAHRFR